MPTTYKCAGCGIKVPYELENDLCGVCTQAQVDERYCVVCGHDVGEHATTDMCDVCLEDHINTNLGPADPEPRLKLFKVTIPSQTISQQLLNRKGIKKVMVGDITDYGFIQGREIIVLGTDTSKIFDQCLRELGCVAQQVDMKVEEIKGPFKHGYVIAHKNPAGM